MGCFSFHETKNIMSGEGGLFVTNSSIWAERAEIIREKGTNRSKFSEVRLINTRGWTKDHLICRVISLGHIYILFWK